MVFRSAKNTTYNYLKNMNIDFSLKNIQLFIPNNSDNKSKLKYKNKQPEDDKKEIKNLENYNQFNLLNNDELEITENIIIDNEEEQIFTTIHNLKYYNSVFQKFYNQTIKMIKIF